METPGRQHVTDDCTVRVHCHTVKHALQYLTFVGAMHDVPCFSEEMSRKEHKNIMHTTNEDRVFVIVAPKPVQTPSMECE